MSLSFEARDVNVRRLGRSDREIVEGIAVKEPGAARALVAKYGNFINRRVWRLLGADSEHEDMVQQVFVTIVNSLHRLENPDVLADWIGTITVNTVRNELRRRRFRRILHFTDEPVDMPETAANPEEQLFLKRGLAVLNKMNTEDRILFVMKYVEGAELKDIAAQTGRSLATVKRRLAKAREVFKKKAERDSFLFAAIQEGLKP